MGTDKNKLRRVFGYVLLGLSGCALFVGLSPLFRIYGLAYLMSALFATAGVSVLAGKEIRDLTRRIRSALGGSAPDRVAIDPILPVKVLGLAKERSGTLTVSEVAISLKVPINQAEAALDACVRSGAAMPDYDVSQGFTRFRFPEFLPPDDRTKLLG